MKLREPGTSPQGLLAVERREGAILVYLSRRISDDLGLRINLGNEIAEVQLQNLEH